MVNGVCDEAFWELGKDPITQMTVEMFLQRIDRKPIT